MINESLALKFWFKTKQMFASHYHDDFGSEKDIYSWNDRFKYTGYPCYKKGFHGNKP